jgi:predicted house-cleaning noncanonical NTP pyrophosphatase (MazG superfamily)
MNEKELLSKLDEVISMLADRRYKCSKDTLVEIRKSITDFACPACGGLPFITKEEFEQNFAEDFCASMQQEVQEKLSNVMEEVEEQQAIVEVAQDFWKSSQPEEAITLSSDPVDISISERAQALDLIFKEKV